MMNNREPRRETGEIRGPYEQSSIRKRIEALFLDNLGRIITREQIIEVATDPNTRRVPENWHQRLSELRCDEGYTILSRRDDPKLAISEYVMPTAEKRPGADRRAQITDDAWEAVLERAGYRCEWEEDGQPCGLAEGAVDPIGGGTVKLTPDHKTPHSIDPDIDPSDPDKWQALCGRHQVMKKNYWDNITGKLNVYAIVQGASEEQKRAVYEFLKDYFSTTTTT